jgi:hypothetical protein
MDYDCFDCGVSLNPVNSRSNDKYSRGKNRCGNCYLIYKREQRKLRGEK